MQGMNEARAWVVRIAVLFVAMVTRSGHLLRQEYPHARFVMPVWGDASDTDVFEQLRRNGIEVHFIENILPKFHTAPEAYRVHAHEGHPNALAHDIISDYIVEHVIRR